jgi:YebC/PmpR family DNA-binding regulatory protein
MKRWGAMSKAFTKIGKQIAMAVKAGGPSPEANYALKIALQNAKGVAMPKDKVEQAIKRAVSKDMADYEEVIYEGYAPHGIAILVDCSTDNINRTVANVRAAFNKYNGALSTSGSVAFMFDKKAVFKFPNDNYNIEDLELELIDYGLDDIGLDEEDNSIIIYTAFNDFATMQKALEDKGITLTNSEYTYLPQNTIELSEEQIVEVDKLIERLEDDEDVNNVYTSLA